MSTFKEVLTQVVEWLQQDGRVSYLALQLQFNLDDNDLANLKEALAFSHPQAYDEDGRGLVWTGEPPARVPGAQPEIGEAQPELLAHHYTEATLTEPAIRYWHRAGEQAAQRSAHAEAIDHLTQALELLMTLPDTPERDQQELTLQLSLSASLRVTKGYTAAEVEQTCTRQQELCLEVGEPFQVVQVLYGLYAYHVARGNLTASLALGEQFLPFAQRQQGSSLPYTPALYGELLENGNLLVGGVTGNSPVTFGGAGGTLLELDWDSNLVWEYVNDCLHHDYHRLPNGNTMVLAWEQVPADMVPHIQGGVPGTEHEGHIWCDIFQEITPEQQVVWEWHAYEPLDLATDIICHLDQRREWSHCNTCHVLPNGDVLTSFRLLNTVAIIDRQSGDWRWKWGKAVLGHQHDPSMLPNDHVLLFDNGWHAAHPQPRSRVLEVDPATEEIVWTYETQPGWKFFSSFIRGAQRLPNENTLICEGMTGRLFEVTSAGEIVWEYINPFFGDSQRFGRVNLVFRAYRYAADFPGLQGKALNPEQYTWLNHLHMR